MLACLRVVQPEGYTFDGEEDELYPLLHPVGTGRAPVYPSSRPATAGGKATQAAAAAKAAVPKPIPEEPREREWKMMPRLDSPRRRAPVPAPCLAWDEEEGPVLYTGDEAGRIRKWDMRPLLDCLEAHQLLARDEAGAGLWRTTSLRADMSKSVRDQLRVSE